MKSIEITPFPEYYDNTVGGELCGKKSINYLWET